MFDNKRHRLLSAPMRYALAAALVMVAFLVRWHAFELSSRLAFAWFFVASVVAFFFLGRGPGVLAVLAGAVIGAHVFVAPYLSWTPTPEKLVGVAGFIAFTLLVGWLIGQLQDKSKRLELALAVRRQHEQELRDLYDHAPCAYYSLDANGKFLRVNALMLAWIGCREDEVIGKLGPSDFYSPEGKAFSAAHFEHFRQRARRVGPVEFDLVSRDGTRRRVSMSASVVRDDAGRFLHSRSVMHDITELHRTRAELRHAIKRQEAMLDNELVGAARVSNGRVIWKNRALNRIFGYEAGELDNQSVRLLYPQGQGLEDIASVAYAALRNGGQYRTQLQLRNKQGNLLWADINGVMLDRDTGEALWLVVDISSLMEQRAVIERAAFHDALTGLPNRLLLSQRLAQTASQCESTQRLMAVCFVDLDGFKAVNDRHGHAAGDALLQEVAHRLRLCVREGDTVARLGGDEFALLIGPLAGREECFGILDRIRGSVARPVRLSNGLSAQISASIGVAFYPDHGKQGDLLLGLADSAMYDAKRAGRATIGVHEPGFVAG